MQAGIKLTSVLYSTDTDLSGVFGSALERLSFRNRCVGEDLVRALQQQRADAVLIDYREPADARELLHSLKPSQVSGLLVIAIADTGEQVRDAFSNGAHGAVPWTASIELASRCLRPISLLALRQRRQKMRFDFHEPVQIRSSDQLASFAISRNLSSTGMCFTSDLRPGPGMQLELSFTLNETDTVRTDANVVWSNDSGRTGVRFQGMDRHSRGILSEWIASREEVPLYLCKVAGLIETPLELTV